MSPTTSDPAKLPPLVMKVVNAVCARHGLNTSDLFGDMFDREVVDCRSEILFRLRTEGHGVGVSQLSRWFGKSRSTVMTALAGHKRLRWLAARGAFQ